VSKRANGEGTVFQRADGRWQAQMSLPGHGLDKPRRVTVYGRTQREARAKLRAVEDQARLGVSPARPPTVAEYGGTWFGSTKRIAVELGHLQPTTVRNYRDIWTRHIGPDLGHLRLDQLTPPLLREWQAGKARQTSRRGTPLSPRSLTLIHAVLRTALNDAVLDGLLRPTRC
jgi:integrase